MILTDEQKAEYMQAGGVCCPVCKSHDIAGGSVEIESAQAWQNVTCNECEADWRDVYRLAFVETDEELETPCK